jgi:hypothetical protein
MAHLISYSCRSLAHSPPARDERRDLPVNTLTLFFPHPLLFFVIGSIGSGDFFFVACRWVFTGLERNPGGVVRHLAVRLDF